MQAKRDLGVTMSETPKPNRQCAKAAKKVNPIMREIKAAFIDITPALFHKLYDTSRLRGHQLKLKKGRSRLDMRNFTFSHKGSEHVG